ncbi:uncharacterized protein LOC143181436 [Calliopsis andreniformis]|uniref:uncharacterized protein LOC143181436 n=1 Tax=Calliopsis andreniformis TaxID=337506 RepID=UPI003FCEDE5D
MGRLDCIDFVTDGTRRPNKSESSAKCRVRPVHDAFRANVDGHYFGGQCLADGYLEGGCLEGGRRRSGQRRQRSQQDPLSRFYCESCGKSYKWKESLFKHKRVECGKLPQFPCEICGHRFMHKHHLLKHVTSVHQIGEHAKDATEAKAVADIMVDPCLCRGTSLGASPSSAATCASRNLSASSVSSSTYSISTNYF